MEGKPLVAIFMFALIVVVFGINAFAEKIPLIAPADARIGCFFYTVPVVGGLLTSYLGCGFLSLLNFGVLIAVLIMISYLIWGG